MKGFQYLSHVATLTLDAEKCVGCGRCPEVCPHQVFTLRERRAAIARFDACMECGACAMNCPAGAIAVDAGVGCAAGMITEWLRDRGLTGSGEACCG